MKKMGVWAKRIVSTTLSFAMIFGAASANFAGLSLAGLGKVQAASAVTRQSIHDGTILHAFCWDFNTIKENLPAIADAGYTAVQTSPINACLSIYDGKMLFGETEPEGRWYYHYQPTDWKIGNYQLGTKEEFTAMCAEADKYGIGVIVDIDPNHTTPLYDQVSDDLKNAAGGEDALYHKGSKVENGDQGGMVYNDRLSVTYDAMGGLPDVDTENPGFQEYFYDFLEDCIACGADGFRIDTAKHIALPDDAVPSKYDGEERTNNFYPNMKADIDEQASKDYKDLFVYGEVLDGDASRVAAYQDMLGGTVASNYGGAIRNAVSSGNVSAKRIMNYKISDDTSTGVTYKADEDKLVTWVESHDNYINDKSYNEVDDRAVILGWAIIAAREAGTPLFFSRPMASSKENPWGTNQIGAAGSDIYKAKEVKAVNKFRTAMENEAEYLRNPGNNSSVLMIERGNKGVVIVNASDSEFSLDSDTNLSDGTYVDSVEGNDELYTVVDGHITGTVKAKSVVVLDTKADGDYSTLFFYNTNRWEKVSAVVDNTSYNATAIGDNWYKAIIPAEEFEVKFTDGVNESNSYKITKTSGKFMSANDPKLYFSKSEVEAALNIITKTVYFFNTEGWNTVYAYAFGGGEFLGGWPGKAMTSEGGYWWKSEIKMIGDQELNLVINNGNGTQTVDISMADMSKNFLAVSGEVDGKITVDKYSSKSEAEDALGINGDSTTVYFYNAAGWDKVGVYTWGDIDLGSWPGVQCEDIGDGWWKYTLNATPSTNLNIIFNNFVQGDDGKRQTEDMKVDSLKKVYFIGSKYKYASKADALKALENDNLILEKDLGGNSSGNNEGTITERPVDEEPAVADGEVKIYYHNTADWDVVSMYAWTDGANTEYFGGWPGKQMSHIGNGWYSVSVSEKALTHQGLHLIANNNGNGSQINDVALITERPSDEEPEEPLEPTPSEPQVKPVDEEPEVADGYTRLYTKVDATNTDDVYMYAWLKMEDGSSAGEPFGGWPGQKMMHIGNGWHAVDIENKYLTGFAQVEVEDVVEDATEENTEKVAEEVANETNSEEVLDEVVEETVSEDTVEESTEAEEPDDIISVITNAIDVLTSAFKPMTVSAKELKTVSVDIQYIVHNNNGQQNDAPVVTTVRPSDEELGKSGESETPVEPSVPETPSEPSEPSVPETPSIHETPSEPSTPSVVPSVTETQTEGNTQQSAGKASQSVSASKAEAAVAEPQVPLAGDVKSADVTASKTTKSSKATKKVAAVVDEEVASEESEDEASEENITEETPEDTDVDASTEDETPVEISEEKAPAAASESSIPVVPIAAGAVVVVAAVGGTVFLRRKHI